MRDIILKNLNERQRAAATETEGYIRVVAGAGSGKTRTLTARYMYLAEMLGVSTASILCVTFTNRAAGEMKKRIRRVLPDRDLGRITTFHGFCVSLLKEDISRVGYPAAFVVLDDNDKGDMLKNIFEDMGITSQDMTVQEAIDHIGWRKGGRGYVKTMIDMDLDRLRRLENTASTLKDRVLYRFFYEQRKCYGLDFDDLMYFTLHILKRFPDVREKWQKRMEYVMVDEFQDIDKDQYELAEILSGHHKNLFIVGDPDQTIYTWRGADVNFMLEFPSRHPETKTILLTENYRSTPEILAAANELISKNRNRMKKELTALRPRGRKPVYYHGKSQAEEARWISSEIARAAKSGISYSDIAVLYRAHYVSRAVEEALIKEKIPYVLYSGVEFYKRKEIKDVLCYLRMVHTGDDAAFLRTVNEPKRKVGRTRIAALKEYAQLHECSLFDALKENLDTKLFSGCGAREYVRTVEKYRAIYSQMTLTDLLSGILSDSGYENMLRVSGQEDRLDNLAELKQAVYDYESKAGEDVTLSEYLNHAALFSGMDTNDTAGKVKLMTVHAAKGLEFSAVFLCGMSEGIFPAKKTNTREKLEEERRLAYVAFTRAEDMLYISDAESINFGGGVRSPSRFILNAGEENLSYVNPVSRELMEQTELAAQKLEPEQSAPVRRGEYIIGDRVEHEIFGKGEVIGFGEGGTGYIVQFDAVDTPRTISFSCRLTPAA